MTIYVIVFGTMHKKRHTQHTIGEHKRPKNQ